MDRLVTLLVTLVVAIGIGLGLDRLPAWSWDGPIPFIGPHIRFEGGPLTQAQARGDRLQAQLDAEHAQAAAVEGQREGITTAAKPVEAKHQREIEVRYRTLREKVTEYVPLHTPPGVIGADDLVPGRTLVLLDAAARGEDVDAVPTLAGESFEAASGLRFTELVDNYVLNLGVGHQIRQQLLDAQDWAQAQQALDAN